MQIENELRISENSFCIQQVTENKVMIGGQHSIMIVNIDLVSKNMNVVKKIPGHKNQINCLKLFNKSFLLSGSFDGSIILWKYNLFNDEIHLLAKVFPSSNGASPLICKIEHISHLNIFMVTNNTNYINLFKINLKKNQIEELPPLKGFGSKISSINLSPKTNRIFGSYHSSPLLHEIILK